jgi:DNA mismatch endonuclease (patch repair protein)
VLSKWNAVVEVRGCFWHRHEGCRYATTPDENAEKWAAKFQANLSRDRRTEEELQRLGWRIAVVWECAVRARGAKAVAQSVNEWLRSDLNSFEAGDAES